jgi:hypothetical protein
MVSGDHSHPACPGSRAVQGLTRGAPLSSATLARRWLHRGAAVVSFAIPAMARTLSLLISPGRFGAEQQCGAKAESIDIVTLMAVPTEPLSLERRHSHG